MTRPIRSSRGPRGRGSRPGRRGSGRTRRGRRGPGGPIAGRGPRGGSRSPCGRSGRPGSAGGPGRWPGPGPCAGGRGPGRALGRGHEVVPEPLPGVAEGLDGLGEVVAAGGFEGLGARRGPGPGPGPRSPGRRSRRRPGSAITSGTGPASRSSSADLDPLAGDLRRAGRLQRRQGERRAGPSRPARSVGRANRICRPSSIAAPATSTSARPAAVTQGIRPSTRNRPGPTSSARTAWSPWRLRGGQLRDPDRGEGPALGDRLDPSTGDRPVDRGDQPAEPGVVLREDEGRRHRALGHPGVAPQERRPVALLAAELAGQRPSRGARPSSRVDQSSAGQAPASSAGPSSPARASTSGERRASPRSS